MIKFMQPSSTQVLLVDCVDRPGLINAITGLLLRYACNIISNREFVDQENNRFYMRTEFEGEIGDRSVFLTELKSILPDQVVLKMPQRAKKKLIVLATSEHHCLAELLIRNAYEDLNIDIMAVICNHDNLRELVDKFSLPFHFVPNNDTDRAAYEEKLLQVVENYDFDLMVLAKYMRILSPAFVAKFPERIINIHHSFLPAFIGANPYRQAYDRGVKIIGATAHFVTNELDMGPIIIQDTAPITHTFDLAAMKKAGQDIEKIALVKALRYVCADKVFINGNKTIVFA